MSHRRRTRLIAVAITFLVCPSVLAQGVRSDVPLKNWTVPGLSQSDHLRRQTHIVGNTPTVFVTIEPPCRLTDSRVSSGGPGPIGGVGSGGTRDYDFIPTPGCGSGLDLLPNVVALSLNFTVVGPLGSGFMYAYPTGNPPGAPVSIINYNAGELRNNAAIVTVNTSTGSFTVATGVNGTDVIIDINGLFISTLEDSTTFAITGNRAAGSAISGTNSNTGNESAGVKGVGGASPTSTTPNSHAGVRGESTSGTGVLGLSQSAGVVGTLLHTSGSVLAAGYLGYSVGNSAVYASGDIGATGMKFFVEPHPTDPSKVIRYVALEGPEPGTYFRGSGRTVRGWARVPVPESFRLVTADEGLTVHLTPVGDLVLIAVMNKDLNEIVVRSARDVSFDYEVRGRRRSVPEFEPIAVGGDFAPPSPQSVLPGFLSDEAKRRLITNGTYNADGSVNLTTADRLGWTEVWKMKASQDTAGR